LTANHIHVSRSNQKILIDISLKIPNHDFLTIIGPNGAGKSMLLKCLMGFYQPDSGTIIKKNHLKIGYVPQKIYCDTTLPLSVIDFLKLNKKISSSVFDNIIQETHIENFIKRPLHVLSGGQLQRVLLARSLLHDPELLILDEPAQNLDISGQLAFYKLIDKIYLERKLAVIMVSHDLHMVMASSRRVICLFHHICCTGTPNMITKDPEFIALFGQDMAEMMGIYQHTHNHKCHHDEH
jgi:zinc transport system ATP-binding protein